MFLDMVPDNRQLVPIYNKLKRLYSTSGRRVVVLPIICSECYFIRSIQHSPVIQNAEALRYCVEVSPWWKSPIVGVEDLKFCKNFEKYCKLFLLKAVSGCVKHTRGNDVPNTAYAVSKTPKLVHTF